MASNWEVLKHDDGKGVMDEGRGKSNLKESIQVFPTRRSEMTTSKKEKWDTTPGGDAKRGLAREPLVWALGLMGHVREAQGEVLVVGNVQQHATLHFDV